jgi:hypothetical protein
MDSNTRVKDCPLRKRYHESVRNYGGMSWWGCSWPEGHVSRPRKNGDGFEGNFSCNLHGSSKLCKCEDYSDWSEKQVRDAFKKLEEIEKHRDAVLAVMRM